MTHSCPPRRPSDLPFESAKRQVGGAGIHAVAGLRLRRKLGDIKALERSGILFKQPMTLEFAGLADVVPLVLVAADAQRRLARRAAVERPLKDSFEKGIEPRILVRLNGKNRRHDQRRPGEHSRSDESAPTYIRSEEHTSELQSLMRNSYAVFC